MTPLETIQYLKTLEQTPEIKLQIQNLQQKL